MSDTLPPKKQVALELLEGASLFVHLDPRADDVQVPSQFHGQTQLVLQLGLNMAVAITDLDVNDEGIACTLSFNRTPHWCVMPWKAVYALIGEDGRGMVWPEDVPPELAAESRRASLKVVGNNKKPSIPSDELPNSVAGDAAPAAPSPVMAVPDAVESDPGPKRPQLALATVLEPAVLEPAVLASDGAEDGDASDTDGDGGDDSNGGGGKKLPSYLRVIK
jgi:stringent starvation protein B